VGSVGHPWPQRPAGLVEAAFGELAKRGLPPDAGLAIVAPVKAPPCLRATGIAWLLGGVTARRSQGFEKTHHFGA